MESERTCCKCGIKKDSNEFRVDSRYGSLRTWCIECDREYSRKYYLRTRQLKNNKIKTVFREGWRVCLRCNIEKEQSEFYKKGGNTCKECAKKGALKNYLANRERGKIISKKYRKKNRQRIKVRAAEYRKKINHTKYSNEKNKEYRRKLTDGFVKKYLREKCGLYNSQITAERIDVERAKILAGRIKKIIEKCGVKICSICACKKDISEFPLSSYWWKGVKKYRRINVCKECEKKRNKMYRKKKTA